MKISIVGKKIEITEATKDWTEKKFAKLDKFFDGNTEVTVVIEALKQSRHTKVEATIVWKGIIFRAELSGNDLKGQIDKSVDVIERQIGRNKSRLEKRFHGDVPGNWKGIDMGADYVEDDYKLVKTKKFNVKPMSVEDAIMQMEMLEHEFFLFVNEETNIINVVYKRKDGDYGLLVPIQ
jgi:putative sigma-54 modulation protein